MKIKRLEVPYYISVFYDHYEEYKDDDFWNHVLDAPEVQPVMHRDGVYLTKDTCWFEYKGHAREYSRGTFLYELRMLNAEEAYNKRVYETIHTLLFVHRVPNADLLDRYLAQRDMLAIRETYRSTRKHCMSNMKAIKSKRI